MSHYKKALLLQSSRSLTEVGSLKKIAIKAILANLHKYSAQDVHNLPEDLIQEILAYIPAKRTFTISNSLIGTIKLNYLPIDRPRRFESQKFQEKNLLLCVREDSFDQKYRSIALYSGEKDQNYTIHDLAKLKPLKSFCAALEPEITCYTVHPFAPLLVFGTADGVVVLINFEKNIPKEFYKSNLPILAVGFDVENECIVSCVCNKAVYIFPLSYACPTIKIENAHVLCNLNLFEDAPVYFNKRNKLPSVLLHPEKPLFNQILFEFYIISQFLKKEKTSNPLLIQRIDQAKNYIEKLEIEATSQKALLADLNDTIELEKQKESEELNASWSWIFPF